MSYFERLEDVEVRLRVVVFSPPCPTLLFTDAVGVRRGIHFPSLAEFQFSASSHRISIVLIGGGQKSSEPTSWWDCAACRFSEVGPAPLLEG